MFVVIKTWPEVAQPRQNCVTNPTFTFHTSRFSHIIKRGLGDLYINTFEPQNKRESSFYERPRLVTKPSNIFVWFSGIFESRSWIFLALETSLITPVTRVYLHTDHFGISQESKLFCRGLMNANSQFTAAMYKPSPLNNNFTVITAARERVIHRTTYSDVTSLRLLIDVHRYQLAF